MAAFLAALAIVSFPDVGVAAGPAVPAPRAAEPKSMRVLIEPAGIEGELPEPDRIAVLRALRRGIASPGYAVLADPASCTTRACEDALAQQRKGAHRVELHVVAGSRTFEIELRAYRPDQRDPYATAVGRCDICGIAELEQLVLSKADALRQRLASDEPRPATILVTSEPSGAQVLIDGKAVGVTPYEGEVVPGAHQVELARKGYFGEHERVDATRGVRERVHASLDALPRTGRRTIAGGITLGIGLAALAGGITMLALDGREIASRCDASQRDLDGDCRWIHRTMAGGIIMTIAGSALATTGATLLIVDRRNSKRYALRTTVGPQRIALTLSF
ncbi:MAG: PEGA domain-containing protein [Deltaproteobacteria bacterium]|nr:PEGA domain-containing protein [Nannocystaceae bacterium]